MTQSEHATAAQVLIHEMAATRRFITAFGAAIERLKDRVATVLVPSRANRAADHVAAPEVFEDLYYPNGAVRRA